MAFVLWDAVMQHKECWHMALISARCNQVNEYSLPSKSAGAASSSEPRWWPLRPVM